jgi:hypothetical protein
MSVTIVQSTVKHPAGKVFPSKYEGKPDRVNAVFSAGGQDITIWGDAGGELTALQRGQPATLIFDGKNYSLAQAASEAPPSPISPAPSPATIVPTVTPQHAEAAWDAKLDLVVARYGKALEAAIGLAQAHLGMSEDEIDNPANRAVLQPMAAALFIEANRR